MIKQINASGDTSPATLQKYQLNPSRIGGHETPLTRFSAIKAAPITFSRQMFHRKSPVNFCHSFPLRHPELPLPPPKPPRRQKPPAAPWSRSGVKAMSSSVTISGAYGRCGSATETTTVWTAATRRATAAVRKLRPAAVRRRAGRNFCSPSCNILHEWNMYSIQWYLLSSSALSADEQLPQ